MASSEKKDFAAIDADDQNYIQECDPIPSDYLSKPIRSETCTIPDNIISFQHSYGYNCKKKFNICVVGGNTVIFIAGNIMTFFDIQTKRISFRRSAMGGGIGFICANATTSHFAVGEKGISPPIIIYEWPSMEVVSVLRNGTKKAFTYLSYSHDGSLLCSQGNEPDFMITIWDWKNEKIILQCKSYGQEVSKCIFSPYKANVLISVGNGHIKFWKIVQTFTGLKMEGELGIFDKTEATDIVALLPMPNGMILCGCEWGNMLLWNGNFIKYEISKRIPKTCHDGPITTILYDEETDKLLTVGMDGCIKLWSYGPIHKTEMPDDMHIVGCLPIKEYDMKNSSSSFLSAEKQFPNDPNDESWVVQDAKGAIWRMILSVKSKCKAEDCFLRAPSGKIVGIACSPSGSLIAAFSEDGSLYIYDYILEVLLGYKIFFERGTYLMWIPLKVDMRGNKLILGFETGVVRVVSLNFLKNGDRLSDSVRMKHFTREQQQRLLSLYHKRESEKDDDEDNENIGEDSEDRVMDEMPDLRSRKQSFWAHTRKSSFIKVAVAQGLDNAVKEPVSELGVVKCELLQALKPHTKPVSVLSHNSTGSIFVSGSQDATVFLFDVLKTGNTINLKPIGFISIPSPVTYIDWKPNKPDTILICCSEGHVVEIDLSIKDYLATRASYKLYVEQNVLVFKSIKSQILRDRYLDKKEKHKSEKRERKQKELDAMREERGRLDIDPELYLADSEEEEELEPLYIPEAPNPVLFGHYTESGNVRLSVGGYDAGFLYEYEVDTSELISSIAIEEAEDIEMHSFIFSSDRKYLILGMGDGKIRLIKLKPGNPTDFSDYWILPMHDSIKGAVRKFCYSFDNRMLFSCGDDGNIFSYRFNLSQIIPPSESMTSSLFLRRPSILIPVEDILKGESFLSLEEQRLQDEKEEQLSIAESHKKRMLENIGILQNRFEVLLDRNMTLPKSQQFSDEDFELHPGITKIVTDYNSEQNYLLQRKYAWKVEKSRLMWDKIDSYFINCLETLTPKISTFRGNIQVEGYRVKKITEQFHKVKEAVIEKVNEQNLKYRLNKRDSIAPKVILSTSPPPATFESIMSAFIPPGNIDFSKMNIRAIRVMENYVKHKQKIEKRNAEWDALFNSKPSDKKNDIEDMKAIDKAQLTIGDYKLKTSSNYRVPSHLRITTMKKYDQLLRVHYKIYEVKKAYNEKICQLITVKNSLVAFLQHLLSELEKIESECTSIPKTYSEKTKIFQEILEKYQEEMEKTEINFAEKYERVKKFLADDISWLYISGIPLQVTNFNVSREMLESATLSDNYITPWELEMASIEKDRQLHNMDVIYKTVYEEVTSFDRSVEVLNNEKSSLDLELKFLEHFLITLQEELFIIRNFEAKEESLTEKVQEKLLEKNAMQEKIIHLQDLIETKKQHIDDLLDQQKEITSKFNSVIENEATAGILKKIYKKKFKPPKPESKSESSEEESSSSESSSDTSEEDFNEDLSVLPTRIDDTVCPDGCAPELFEMVLKLRSQRHKVEMDVIEGKKQMDSLKKDLELHNKKIKIIDNAYQKNDADLDAFQREKQRELNNLDVVVLLNLNQMQQLSSPTDLGALSECVLFSKDKLSKLHLRTKELVDETEHQKQRHRALKKHLHRLKVDCKHMNFKNLQLKEELNQRMKKKFGKIVDIVKLKQALLHKFIMEFRSQAQEIRDMFEQGYAEWQKQIYAKQNKLTEVITANTEKMSLLAALQEEKTKLDKILKYQHKSLDSTSEQKIDFYQSDIANLVKIKKHQQKQMDSLKAEILRLSRKTRHGSLPPLECANTNRTFMETDSQLADNQSTFKTEISDEMTLDEEV